MTTRPQATPAQAMLATMQLVERTLLEVDANMENGQDRALPQYVRRSIRFLLPAIQYALSQAQS